MRVPRLGCERCAKELARALQQEGRQRGGADVATTLMVLALAALTVAALWLGVTMGGTG